MTACPRIDFHIHTKYLKCANETMEVLAIVRECERLGVTRLGITDHLNTPDKVELHRYIREDIQALATNVEVFFGVELNYMACDGEFAFSPEIKEEYGFQFAIGGIHSPYLDEYDLKAIVDIQHRHHLNTCSDPLVDVLVHPYWFSRREFDSKGWPWFDAMPPVPERYARELGQAAKATGTAIEINGSAILTSPVYSERFVKEYMDYLTVLAEEGASFSFGSDAHDISKLESIEAVWQAAEQLGIGPERIWQPQCGCANNITAQSR
jgi:histidinol phosphatase-like PHP family hydrolase